MDKDDKDEGMLSSVLSKLGIKKKKKADDGSGLIDAVPRTSLMIKKRKSAIDKAVEDAGG